MAKKPPLEIRYKGKQIRIGDIERTIMQLPKNIRGAAVEFTAKEFIKHYKKYPRYKYVSRLRAYPEVGGFFSDKQRRYVMAKIADGTMNPGRQSRTRALQNGWHIEGRLSPLQIVNDAPGAVYAYHPIYQARQLDLVGWKDINEMTTESEATVFDKLIQWMNKELIVEFDKILLKR